MFFFFQHGTKNKIKFNSLTKPKHCPNCKHDYFHANFSITEEKNVYWILTYSEEVVGSYNSCLICGHESQTLESSFISNEYEAKRFLEFFNFYFQLFNDKIDSSDFFFAKTLLLFKRDISDLFGLFPDQVNLLTFDKKFMNRWTQNLGISERDIILSLFNSKTEYIDSKLNQMYDKYYLYKDLMIEVCYSRKKKLIDSIIEKNKYYNK